MKLSEFKAQYFPWSKEYKLREKQEAEAREKANKEFWDQYRKGKMDVTTKQAQAQLASMALAQQQAYQGSQLKYGKASQQQPTTTSSSSSSTFGDALLGSLVGNVIGNAISSHSSSSDSYSSSSSSSSDSSSSWSDSSSSSWSDSSSSSWD